MSRPHDCLELQTRKLYLIRVEYYATMKRREKKPFFAALRHIIMNFMISAFHFAGVDVFRIPSQCAFHAISWIYESNDIAKSKIHKCLKSHINSNGNIDAKLTFSLIILVSTQQHAPLSLCLSLLLFAISFRVCRSLRQKQCSTRKVYVPNEIRALITFNVQMC